MGNVWTDNGKYDRPQTIQELVNAQNALHDFVRECRTEGKSRAGAPAVQPAALLSATSWTAQSVADAAQALRVPFRLSVPAESPSFQPMSWAPCARVDRRFRDARYERTEDRTGRRALGGVAAIRVYDGVTTEELLSKLRACGVSPATTAETDAFVAAFVQAGGFLQDATIVALGDVGHFRNNPQGEELSGHARFSNGTDVQLFQHGGGAWSNILVLGIFTD